MITDKGIRIQNIYYMLAYAFKALEGKCFEKLGSEEFENTADLLAIILARGISMQVKRGLGREYIPTTEPLSILRGKIDISHSIKSQTVLKKQLICNYDNFSINTTCNQIIKATVTTLFRANIQKNIKRELKNLMLYFKEVDNINPYTIDWNITFHRNNASYQMLINICYLILKGLLQKDEDGNLKMQKFLDEQRMCRLYEKFILEYYKKHSPELRVSSAQIPWKVEADNEYLDLLPKMQSDIMLSTKDGTHTLIIDAKYYAKSMQTQYEKKTLHSHNLYQIFTYVKNADIKKHGEVSGMLLYAKTDEEISPESEFEMDGNRIIINCLDLSVEFKEVSGKLDMIKRLWLSGST